MNAENPIQIDLFGVSATGTKDTMLAEHIGGYFARPSPAAGTFGVAALAGLVRIDPDEAPGRRCGRFRAAIR
jgi:hypothetical protein